MTEKMTMRALHVSTPFFKRGNSMGVSRVSQKLGYYYADALKPVGFRISLLQSEGHWFVHSSAYDAYIGTRFRNLNRGNQENAETMVYKAATGM
jgi:hypothetical protein